MYRIATTTTQNREPQLPHASRSTNPHVSKSSGVNHTTSVSRPQLKCYQGKDKVVPNNSQREGLLKGRKYLKDMIARTLDANIVQLILFIVDSGCTKHMTGNLKLLCNFVEKFLGTVRFGNDQFAPILGYGDLNQGNVTIKRVYYVEGLNHNPFLVGVTICDVDLEGCFQKSTCFSRKRAGFGLKTAALAKLFENRRTQKVTNCLQGAYDHEAGSSRAKRSRSVETVEEALLPDVHHEFLEWRGYSREEKSRYKSRLATLLPKLIYSPQIVDWQLLYKIGCGDEIDQMLKISLKEAQTKEEVLFSVAWVRAFNIRKPIYPELCHEFYATYEFDEVCADNELQSKKIISFRLGGHPHSLTLLEFARRLGLYHADELEEEGFDTYFQGGLRSDENFNAREY
ncbi:hypothetical protein Tco_1144128 [Tanacetum coccineum]